LIMGTWDMGHGEIGKNRRQKAGVDTDTMIGFERFAGVHLLNRRFVV
jgi:hypothetical protein